MSLDAIVLLATLAIFALLGLAEHSWPGYRFPLLPGWRARSALVTLLALGISIAFPLVVGDMLAAHALFDLSGLGTGIGAVAAVLLYELGHYWWHRALHTVPLLWRFHQLHHSAERLDVWGAYFLHPMDVLGFVSVQLSAFLLFGFSAEAIAVASVFLGLNSIFQHANLRTPRWLGYFVQRPEAHAVHHSRDVHGKNYSDLPLWDLLFGTFEAPVDAPTRLGFWDGASARIGDLLLGRNVSGERSTPARHDETHRNRGETRAA